MGTGMALLDAFFYIIFTTVLFYTCSAVTVTVDDLGDIIEGIETRMMCNIVRTRPGSTGDPLIIWNNITSGVDQIGSLQSGSKFINDAYIDRFDVDVNDGSLVISNTLRSDSGTYQCSVTIFDDIPGAGDDDVVLDVIYLEIPSLDLDTPVIKGERVELTCDVVANPAPVITFKKDGTSVQSGGNTTYVIHSVDRNDEGNYECEVMNGAGTKSTASQMLEVYYVPEITSLNNIETSPGETVVIDFNVKANPAAVYEWTTNPATTDTDNNLNTYTFVVYETIDTVYTVTLNASNVVGASQESVNVTVVALPPSETPTTDIPTTVTVPTLPPKTPIPPTDDSDPIPPWVYALIAVVVALIVTAIIIYCVCFKKTVKVCPGNVNVGDVAVMRYKYCGQVSNASFTWYKCDENGSFNESSPIVGSDKNIDGRFSFTENGLEISDVEKSDAGYYACVVTEIENGRQAKGFNKLTVNAAEESKEQPLIRPATEAMEMNEGKDGLSRYQAPGGELYTQVNLKQKETKPAQVDKNVEGLMYADLDLTRNLPKDQKDTIHHPEPETMYASIQQQHSTKI